MLISLIFFGIIGFASDIINIPFSCYDTFVIEKKYGFNTMTVRTFITDHIKSWFIALLVGSGTWTDYLVLLQNRKLFLALCMGTDNAFFGFHKFFYSELIVPLFNKQTPLEEGP